MLGAERISTGEHVDQTDPVFQDGLRALASADWGGACTAFKSVVERRPECAEAWEGLAEAAYWMPDEETILEARERAYHLYRERGEGWRAADGRVAGRRLGRVARPGERRQRLDAASETAFREGPQHT